MQTSSFFKLEKSNNPFSVFSIHIFHILFVLGGLIAGTSLYSQTPVPFVADQADHTVAFSDTYKDFVIPTNTNIERISFYLRGGSGGIARTSLHPGDITSSEGTTQAGQGAEVFCAFYVGHAPGHIKPGSYVRFIIGGHGGSMSDEGLQVQATGGGGGASAVLVKQPGETVFTHIMIAGGGGGATRGYEVVESEGLTYAIQRTGPGKPGCNTDSGSCGAGAWSGSEGTDGDGGGSGVSQNVLKTPISCGGGGILSTGANNDCGQGAGKKAAQSGAAGGDGDCYFTTFVPGGYGYSSGGAGVIINSVASNKYVSGGGGGGWSGGGGGGVWWAGGGGGGSVIAYDKFTHHAYSNVIIPGGMTATNQNGIGSYYCKLIPPVADCKNIIKELNTSYITFINASEVAGPDAFGTLSISPSSFNCEDIGNTIPVTLTATSNGITEQCTSLVQVVDYSVPTITCPDNILVDNMGSFCSIPVNYSGLYSASDKCTTSVSTISGLPYGAFFPLGTSTVVLKATDQGGNSATCSFKVIVRDVQPPSISCPADIVKNADPYSCVALTHFNVAASDFCSPASISPINPVVPVSVVGPVGANGYTSYAFFPVGVSTIVYKASDAAGNTNTCSFKVTVTDNQVPLLTCKPATVTLNAQGRVMISPSDVFQQGSDNCGSINLQSVTPHLFTCDNLGTNTVILTVNDGNGNTTQCHATVTVMDVTAPTAVCENTEVTLGPNGQVTVFTADLAGESSDNCSIHLSSSRNYYTPGVYELDIVVADESNNTSTCTSIVTVLPRGGTTERSANEASATDNADLPVKLFPNPSTGDASLQINLEEDQTCLIQVIDATGRFVFRQEQAGEQGENIFPINLTGLPPGIYLVDIQAGKQKTTQRLVLQQ